ncbi:unnamed protein product, partial [Ectocarpus fasciculatus]
VIDYGFIQGLQFAVPRSSRALGGVGGVGRRLTSSTFVPQGIRKRLLLSVFAISLRTRTHAPRNGSTDILVRQLLNIIHQDYSTAKTNAVLFLSLFNIGAHADTGGSKDHLHRALCHTD